MRHTDLFERLGREREGASRERKAQAERRKTHAYRCVRIGRENEGTSRERTAAGTRKTQVPTGQNCTNREPWRRP